MFLCSRSDNVKAGDDYTAVYIIRGLSLGRTDVVATAAQHGKKHLITSDARDIQVFTGILTSINFNAYDLYKPSCLIC